MLHALRICHSTYMVNELGDYEALELFTMHAFQKNKLEEDYSELTNQVICYAKGIPLALSIIGALVPICTEEVKWNGKAH